MTDIPAIETNSGAGADKRKRNFLLAVILAGASLAMYVSIFYRMSANPLS